MFGYLRVQKSELLVREWNAYRAVYCGLCKQMGRDYSFLTRLTLSYDGTFYAMLLMSLSRSCKGFDKGRCTCNPLKGCRFARCEDDAYHKAAALSVISVYYKLVDDLTDSGFWRRLLVRAVKPLFSHWHKKAAKRYPELEQLVFDMMDAQRQVETGEKTGVDAAAHPTAQMLARVLSLEARNEAERRIFSEFGYHLGRWIYLIDAADDLEKDIKRQNFNPFRDCPPEDREAYETRVLNQCLARAYDAYQLMTVVDFKGIFDNMLLYGFPAKQNTVVYRLKEEKDDKSV
ncbi:MAG: hypothetical protein II127_04430 [Ruminococcus sp.]|nr:hypothetical protein [Ruminococcus sp.]